MDTDRDDGTPLGWAVRRYALPLTLLVAGTVLLAVYVSDVLRREAQYTATALVIATELQVRQEQLPRFGESVFHGGSVARAVAPTLPDADFRTLVPDRISLDPVPDTIAFRVEGHSRDPQEAARVANVAATAFVEQLNKAGTGVGTFSLQDPAYVPLERDVGPVSPVVAGLLGLMAGTVLAASLLAAAVALRRPLLSAARAAEVVGAPPIGVVTLPRRRGRRRGQRARGVRDLVERLPTLPSSAVELVGPTGSGRARRELLAELGAVRPAPGSDVRKVVVTDLVEGTSVRLRLPRRGPSGHPSGDEALAAVLVVVPEGAGSAVVRDVVGDFPPDEIAGTVFVRRRTRTARRWELFGGTPAEDAAADVSAAAGTGSADGTASASAGRPAGGPVAAAGPQRR